MAVKEGRTIDLQVYLGYSAWLQKVDRVLSGGRPGAGTQTFEPIKNNPDEESSIHAVSQSFEFTNVYDGPETDVIMQHVADSDEPYCAIFDKGEALRHFEIAQVSLTNLPRTQPPADSIVRTLTLPDAARAYFGIGTNSVTRWVLDDTTASVTLPAITADDEVFVIIESSDVDPFQLSVHNLTLAAASVGIRHLTQAAASAPKVASTSTLAAGQEITGWLLIGEAQELPTG